MTIEMGRPGADELGDVVRVLTEWQDDGVPVQLHPGDVGWFWRFGAERTAEATRTWSRAGEVLAVGLLDSADLLRLAFAPQALPTSNVAAVATYQSAGLEQLPERRDLYRNAP